jgi:hypothetical protein
MLKPHLWAAIAAALVALPPVALATNHREAPITALDHKADITDPVKKRCVVPSGSGRFIR